LSLSVSHSANLFDFFQGRVDGARRDLDIALSDETTLYLSNLLVERARREQPHSEVHTLAELHAAAAHKPPGLQAATYRELGDRSLVTVGFFRESLDRKVVGAGYYQQMGIAAYNRVDQVLKRWFSDAFGPIFQELAGNFDDCVAVLDTVRAEHEADDDLVRLYDRWLATGDPELETRLRRRGLVI